MQSPAPCTVCCWMHHCTSAARDMRNQNDMRAVRLLLPILMCKHLGSKLSPGMLLRVLYKHRWVLQHAHPEAPSHSLCCTLCQSFNFANRSMCLEANALPTYPGLTEILRGMIEREATMRVAAVVGPPCPAGAVAAGGAPAAGPDTCQVSCSDVICAFCDVA